MGHQKARQQFAGNGRRFLIVSLADSKHSHTCKHWLLQSIIDVTMLKLAWCNQAVRKLHAHLRAAKEAAVERTLPQLRAPASMQPHAVDMDQELDDAAMVGALACSFTPLRRIAIHFMNFSARHGSEGYPGLIAYPM